MVNKGKDENAIPFDMVEASNALLELLNYVHLKEDISLKSNVLVEDKWLFILLMSYLY